MQGQLSNAYFSFKKEKPTQTEFGDDGTCSFAKKTTRDYEKLSPLMMNFLRQSESTAIEPEPKKERITV